MLLDDYSELFAPSKSIELLPLRSSIVRFDGNGAELHIQLEDGQELAKKAGEWTRKLLRKVLREMAREGQIAVGAIKMMIHALNILLLITLEKFAKKGRSSRTADEKSVNELPFEDKFRLERHNNLAYCIIEGVYGNKYGTYLGKRLAFDELKKKTDKNAERIILKDKLINAGN